MTELEIQASEKVARKLNDTITLKLCDNFVLTLITRCLDFFFCPKPMQYVTGGKLWIH